MRDLSVTDTIGKTPLVRLGRLAPHSRLYAKLESRNPGGSVKDRIAKSIVEAAQRSGELTPGGLLVEATSGNTGIGLAMVAAAQGYKLILTMPENMNVERRRLLSYLGAEIVLTPAIEGMSGAVWKAQELARERGGFLARQFENPANPEAHRLSTALEIWDETEGTVDIFVAGVGTGGTLTGVGEILKEKKPSIELIAVEPARSAVLSGGRPGLTRIHGLGAGFAPGVLNQKIIDRVLAVQDEDAIAMSREIARKEGIMAGISAGAAAFAALQVAQDVGPDKVIVTVFPDSGERYLSMMEDENP